MQQYSFRKRSDSDLKSFTSKIQRSATLFLKITKWGNFPLSEDLSKSEIICGKNCSMSFLNVSTLIRFSVQTCIASIIHVQAQTYAIRPFRIWKCSCEIHVVFTEYFSRSLRAFTSKANCCWANILSVFWNHEVRVYFILWSNLMQCNK